MSDPMGSSAPCWMLLTAITPAAPCAAALLEHNVVGQHPPNSALS
jgi:hypothetical protein